MSVSAKSLWLPMMLFLTVLGAVLIWSFAKWPKDPGPSPGGSAVTHGGGNELSMQGILDIRHRGQDEVQLLHIVRGFLAVDPIDILEPESCWAILEAHPQPAIRGQQVAGVLWVVLHLDGLAIDSPLHYSWPLARVTNRGIVEEGADGYSAFIHGGLVLANVHPLKGGREMLKPVLVVDQLIADDAPSAWKRLREFATAERLRSEATRLMSDGSPLLQRLGLALAQPGDLRAKLRDPDWFHSLSPVAQGIVIARVLEVHTVDDNSWSAVRDRLSELVSVAEDPTTVLGLALGAAAFHKLSRAWFLPPEQFYRYSEFAIALRTRYEEQVSAGKDARDLELIFSLAGLGSAKGKPTRE